MTGSQKNVFFFSAFSVVNGCCNVAVCFSCCRRMVQRNRMMSVWAARVKRLFIKALENWIMDTMRRYCFGFVSV